MKLPLKKNSFCRFFFAQSFFSCFTAKKKKVQRAKKKRAETIFNERNPSQLRCDGRGFC